MKINMDLEMIVHLLEYYGEQLYLYKAINPARARKIKKSITKLCDHLDEMGYNSKDVLTRIDTKINLAYEDRPVYAYVDGAVRGSHDKSIENESAVAFAIYDGTSLKLEDYHMIEPCSSVIAEYKALIEALRRMLQIGLRKREVHLYSDYKPIVRQLQMRYKASNPKLVALRDEARSLIERFSFIDIEYIPRSGNAYADMLVNKALDEAV